jgi:hypothetical protein
MLAVMLLAVIPDVSIAICRIAGIGVLQAESAAVGNTNSAVASKTDTSLRRPVMMFCKLNPTQGRRLFL